MQKYFLLVTLILVIGCNKSSKQFQKINKPPIFNKGDVVKLQDSLELGIVVDVIYDWNEERNWNYKIMFRETNMFYEEKYLILHERMVWHTKSDSQAELNQAKFEY